MSTWQLISDSGDNYRWETSSLQGEEEHQGGGYSKLVDNGKSDSVTPALFFTGLGKSVAVKPSSIAKARSILGGADESVVRMNSRLRDESDCGGVRPDSMFRTGSGKAVHISQVGLNRAKTLLSLDENVDGESLPGFEKIEKRSASMKLDAFEAQSYPTVDSIRNKSGETMSIDGVHIGSKPPSVQFQTAGGRYVTVSTDALQRARNLLGDIEIDSFLNEACKSDSLVSVKDVGKQTCSRMLSVEKGRPNGSSLQKKFSSSIGSNPHQNRFLFKSKKLQPGTNLISKFDAEADCNPSSSNYNELSQQKEPSLRDDLLFIKVDCLENGALSKVDPPRKLFRRPLLDISNTTNLTAVDDKQLSVEKKRIQKRIHASSFKKPRCSFIAPLNKNKSFIPEVFPRLAQTNACCKQRICDQYPFPSRVYVKEFAAQLPSHREMLEQIPEHVRRMHPSTAKNYAFKNGSHSECLDPDTFYEMMVQSGASNHLLTKEWVLNHYKWIVWKLASYERCYPSKFLGKLLTVSNVLQELRYRYEREINHGHRSAIKKILDGDAPPSSVMVLCISSVGENALGKDGKGRAPNIELTDGWYFLSAQLDELLGQKLASGKLFLGQKIRIWGAKLCGWFGPVSPFEASQTASLLLHYNGTYRCHWAEKLGFCEYTCMPLAFRCIRGAGGAVPSTLVGIKRIYPVRYRERLTDGSFSVRSERAEARVLQLYNQRRDFVVEGVVSAFQKEVDYDYHHDTESEGARLMRLLETTAEPEILMAGLSSKQLTSFVSYRAELEGMRQSEIQKSIEKALEAAGLGERDITPFLQVRVVGMMNKSTEPKYPPREGMITIWNPTEKQISEMCEGQVCQVSGLVPSSSDSDFLHLQARGSSSSWLPLSAKAMDNFMPLSMCRTATTISSLNEVLPSCEFDISAFVVHVSGVCDNGHYQKQWVFVTDGSTDEIFSKNFPVGLLAINFGSLEIVDLVGSVVVGFCNLIRRPSDQVNGIWIAEATENSDYFLSYDHKKNSSHLRDAASSVSAWASTSSSIIATLKERILSIIGSS
ncbi:hypothetical protein M569_00535, partial [Genlisea aurea]